MTPLNVGRVEPVLRLNLPATRNYPLGWARDIGDMVADKVFGLGVGEFCNFPRLPLEVQDMIWEATFEPRTVRAIGYSEYTPTNEETEIYLHDVPAKHSLVVECNPLHVRCLSIYSVCRRSRAVAMAMYGPLLNNHTVPFHPDLDTVELVGYHSINHQNTHITPFASRYPSEQGGTGSVTLPQDLVLMLDNTDDWSTQDGRIYQQVEPNDNANKLRSLGLWARQWAFCGVPFERAKKVVVCHDAGTRDSLEEVLVGASVTLPNVEVLTIRSYVENMQLKAVDDHILYNRMILGEKISWMFERHEEGCWPRLKTIDFTRQSVSEYIC